MENLPIKPKLSVKSGTISLDQLKSGFKPTKKPIKITPEEVLIRREALAAELRNLLCETYPYLFDEIHPKALAIGIHKEIRGLFPQFEKKVISLFLSQWVKHRRYLEAIISSADRFNLQGQPASLVTEDQKIFAAQSLEQLTEK